MNEELKIKKAAAKANKAAAWEAYAG